ncbi:non-homologous end-joining DNA ligase [Desulfosporosinus nitroreducens]|uniref:Non-homologous end-joining DNA ligase n=1 Tax=Desulfosporosinus nitroreducens TaxID=2018668 RepID=A0ABT8QY61_9FIRM|nr:non-homologous end-joining DNA ligase [Desulfosporosinus nitroreducens]MDO0824836.1 non-homologous end-joining DNA ligase [Desulfosporosinus nitroreducens]
MPELLNKRSKSVSVTVEGKTLSLSNLAKVYFPEQEITKGELIHYYTETAPLILPHLKQSPFVMVRYPEGIDRDFFCQKECPPQASKWVTRYTDSRSKHKLTYVVCDQLATLVYLINLGCIEIHSWASSVIKPNYPRWAIFDLDPDPPSGFQETLKVALWSGKILKEIKMNFLVKTSGATGVHILLPLHDLYTYAEVQRGIEGICRFLTRERPEYCTMERSVKNRKGKVYLDYLQNGRGRTMAGIYSVRPTRLGTVSTPLLWEEVVQGVNPADFNVRTFQKRLEKVGDLSTVMAKTNEFSSILHYFA